MYIVLKLTNHFVTILRSKVKFCGCSDIVLLLPNLEWLQKSRASSRLKPGLADLNQCDLNHSIDFFVKKSSDLNHTDDFTFQ